MTGGKYGDKIHNFDKFTIYKFYEKFNLSSAHACCHVDSVLSALLLLDNSLKPVYITWLIV